MARSRLSHDAVVDTAAMLADRSGLDAVTVTSVASALGVQQPALYRHVDGYDDLLRALSLRGRALLAESLADAALGRSGDDAIRAMAHAWRSFAQDHPGLYEATDRVPSTGDDEMEAAIEEVVRILCRALAGYRLDETAEVHAARSMRSAFHGFCHLELAREHPSPVDLDESYQSLIELVCLGVRSLAVSTAVDSTTATAPTTTTGRQQ